MLSRPATRATIARNLRMLMEARHPPWTQEELAERAGVSQKTVSNLLHAESPGIGSSKLDTIEAVAQVFGLTAWHLLIPSLPDDMKESKAIAKLIEDYLSSPPESRAVIVHTAQRERRLASGE